MEQGIKNADPKKRERLINSGLSEFSTQGFKRSSLNRILKNAIVSKGFFYHYFENKTSFYKYLISYTVNVLLKRFNKEDLLEERDFILRMKKQALYKIEISKDNPFLFPFLMEVYQSLPLEEYLQLVEPISGNFVQRFLTENIDYSLLRDDISQEASMKVITRYIQGVQNEFLDKINLMSYDDMFVQFTYELDVLRQAVYKRGAQ